MKTFGNLCNLNTSARKSQKQKLTVGQKRKVYGQMFTKKRPARLLVSFALPPFFANRDLVRWADSGGRSAATMRDHASPPERSLSGATLWVGTEAAETLARGFTV